MRRLRQVIRDWRWLAMIVGLVIGAGVVIALLQPSPPGYLDPSGTGPTGGRALADLLSQRGQHVDRSAVPVSGGAGSLELVTSPDRLSGAQLRQAARFGGDILLVDPDTAALRAIAPRVRIIWESPGDGVADPDCIAQAATLAGDAYVGGALLRTDDPAAVTCYPDLPGAFLIQYPDATRTITILGSSAPLTNSYLADYGDAALALNLMRRDSRIVWLVPSGAAPASAAGGQQSFFALVPWPAYLIAIQLGIAVLLAAAWRGRRLGPLVAERLPAVVRAAETVEGHGRLYQARRARDRAAAVLREATASRIASRMGGDTGAETIASRTGQPPDQVAALLSGPPPATDKDLVTLAADLDTLERKISQT
ncbi:MAG TPA: DUF4350 domain-containing protein [Trebonia sp.]|nr:DUF4350 domain-containing protein [Trebonia sp.]